jgi:predicted house-cleaning noncanonical NTP pyrophosphatase (MazG superfamily)
VAETSETNLSIQDKKNIDNLISKHKIIPISDIYDNTLSYYNTLITILVAILGVFTFVAWFSVKNKVKAEIEESVRETLNSNTYKELLDAKLNKIIRDYIPDYIADPDTMVECLPIIQKNIETIISGMKDKLKEEISNDVQEKVLESSELKLNKEKSTKTVKGEQNGN